MSMLEISISTTLKALAFVEAKRKELTNHLSQLRSQRVIHCEACTESHQIRELDLIQTHWYVKPSGCSDGDYWNEAELHFICPETKIRNRLLFWDDDYKIRTSSNVSENAEAAFKHLYGGLFRTLVREYDEKKLYSRVNNDYVDRNRDLFDLPLKR